jgi:hypothetical protein
MLPYMLGQGHICSARPLVSLESRLSFLVEFIPHIFSSMLSLNCRESPTAIATLAKGRDESIDCCTTNGVLDQLENRTVIHLEQGMGMGHTGNHVTLDRTAMYE